MFFKNVIQEVFETELFMVLQKIVDLSAPHHTSFWLREQGPGICILNKLHRYHSY